MALVATVSFSKKIPVPDAEYSSQGYSLSLQTEIPETDPAAIQARLSQTFQLVKDQVEHELAKNGNGHATRELAPNGATPAAGKGIAVKASNKQLKFLTDLAGRQGIALSDLNGRIRAEFGVDGLYDLDKKQASALLDQMNAQHKKAA